MSLIFLVCLRSEEAQIYSARQVAFASSSIARDEEVVPRKCKQLMVPATSGKTPTEHSN